MKSIRSCRQEKILRELKSHLSRAANQMKQYVDLKRRDVEFQVGDHVYLKLQPYRQQSVSKRASQKLASRYFGPYRVLERVRKLAYKLELPAGSKVYPVFHVSLLKQHIGDTFPVSDVLPLLSDDGEAILEPATILDTRWIRRGSRTIQESLVLWKHLPQEDATWENSVELQVRFPNLNLEDKVPFKGGSNDGTLRRSSRIPIKNRNRPKSGTIIPQRRLPMLLPSLLRCESCEATATIRLPLPEGDKRPKTPFLSLGFPGIQRTDPPL
ncbi:hypothetical protein GH714_031194 [Hevea brasiliensis]|uniref:Tf2-1-like SH3-like domain-containing protein n=1 Tax=Hevea brasiliensis TaxID=3981 RepID=A0A6A6L5W4_HEVBR|nr:hypothetical protein GH714_031194 [Hevea brasiliensis]